MFNESRRLGQWVIEAGQLNYAGTPTYGISNWGIVLSMTATSPQSLILARMHGATLLKRVLVQEVFCEFFDVTFFSPGSPVSSVNLTIPGGTYAIAGSYSIPASIAAAYMTPTSSTTPISAMGGTSAMTAPFFTPSSAGHPAVNVDNGLGMGPFTPTYAITATIPDLTATVPSYIIGSGSVGVTIPTTNNIVIPDIPITGTVVPGATMISAYRTVSLCLYVAKENVDGSFSVCDPLNVPADGVLSYEDLVMDAYWFPLYLPTIAGYTSRRWRLSLSRPIDLGPGEALIATVSPGSNPGPLISVLCYPRARCSYS